MLFRSRTSNHCRARLLSAGQTRQLQKWTRKTMRAAPNGYGPHMKDVRRRPTLPRSRPRSTIGAERLSFRVRNGAGRFPLAMATETLWSYRSSSRPSLGNRTVDANCRYRASPRPISTGQHTHCCAYTSGLSTQCSRWGPYQVNPVGVLILERASRLDAFSGYPFRT